MSKRSKLHRQKAKRKSWKSGVDIKKLLSELKENRRKIKDNEGLYFDKEQDQADVFAYYQGIDGTELDGLPLYYKLHTLVSKSHINKIPYFLSKDLYLYTWVDLYPDGLAKSIYSSERKDPETLILEDQAKILEKYEELNKRSRKLRLNGFESLRDLKAFEANFKMNTEHIVPQSWFGGKEPMKGDLHHLFVCQPDCNIARSNYPYADFEFYNPEIPDEPVKNHCGVSTGNYFEPEHGKGAAARAMLYFFLRYPKSVKKIFRVQVDIPLLVRWHKQFPPSLYEHHRNQAIYYIQGNRNPFIDYPGLAEKVYFPM